jgi:hypothetical protein
VDRIHVDQDRLRSSRVDRLNGGDERVRHGDHLSPRRHPERDQSKLNGDGAVADTDAVIGSAELSEAALEVLDIGPERELSRCPKTFEGSQRIGA